jgi:ATP-dependent Clp protease ATP-binding subunit ClpC
MKEKEEAVMNQNYEKAAKIRDEEQRIKEQLEERKSIGTALHSQL